MDAERAAKIAKALGAETKIWQTSLTPASLVKQVHLDEKVLWYGWRDVDKTDFIVAVDWPDFALPEWQIKIQEKVETLWVDADISGLREVRVDARAGRLWLYLSHDWLGKGINDYWITVWIYEDKTEEQEYAYLEEGDEEKFESWIAQNRAEAKKIIYRQALLWLAEQKGAGSD